MILILASVICFLSYYFITRNPVNEDSVLTPSVRYGILTVGLLFFFSGYYTYFYLPEQIDRFYNDGAGLTVNGETFFTSTSDIVAYYFGTIGADMLFAEMTKLVAIFGISFGFIFIVYDYAMRHNLMGQKIPKMN